MFFKKGQWVQVEGGPVKEIGNVPIYLLARVGIQGETYGYKDPKTDEIHTLCSLTSAEHYMRPAVGKLGSLVIFDSPVKSVACATGDLNREGFFHEYGFHGQDIVKEDASYRRRFLMTDLVGFFLCHVSGRKLHRINHSDITSCLTLNFIFRPTEILSAKPDFNHRVLETAPYTLSRTAKEIDELGSKCRVLVHGRRVIITNTWYPFDNKRPYPECSDKEVSVWGSLIQDMVAYIELDFSDKILPVNVCPQLDHCDSSIGGIGDYSNLPANPTWQR